ncbi:MAG: hypothetical protein M3R49_03220 [Chloroflexota bacterium]|nr:hypothetical protein [Chloroflexota bacterium]
MRRIRTLPLITALAVIALATGAMNVLANGNDGNDGNNGNGGNNQIRAVPWIFVGTAAQRSAVRLQRAAGSSLQRGWVAWACLTTVGQMACLPRATIRTSAFF